MVSRAPCGSRATRRKFSHSGCLRTFTCIPVDLSPKSGYEVLQMDIVPGSASVHLIDVSGRRSWIRRGRLQSRSFLDFQRSVANASSPGIHLYVLYWECSVSLPPPLPLFRVLCFIALSLFMCILSCSSSINQSINLGSALYALSLLYAQFFVERARHFVRLWFAHR